VSAQPWTPSRQDGHLSELDLELLLGEPETHAALGQHCAGCEPCRSRLDALRDDAAAWAPSASWQAPVVAVGGTTPAPAVPKSANRPWPAIVTALSVAAALLVAVRVMPVTHGEGEDFRVKGASVDLAVFVHDGTAQRAAQPGETVHPGDRLAFRVSPRRGGFLRVVGLDATGAYPCWPSTAEEGAIPVTATGRAQDLDAAVRLDGRLGEERIVAVLCDEAVGYSEVVAALRADERPGGCVTDEVLLHKAASP